MQTHQRNPLFYLDTKNVLNVLLYNDHIICDGLFHISHMCRFEHIIHYRDPIDHIIYLLEISK